MNKKSQKLIYQDRPTAGIVVFTNKMANSSSELMWRLSFIISFQIMFLQ